MSWEAALMGGDFSPGLLSVIDRAGGFSHDTIGMSLVKYSMDIASPPTSPRDVEDRAWASEGIWFFFLSCEETQTD